ncbi:MAG TPA: hypothetical protein VMG12_43670 [Polyangiaceae bacterium]|nr:hypothetical protein [Polyangiaceae bacterium]
MTSPDPIERQLSLAKQGLTPSTQLRARVRTRFGASEAAPLGAAPRAARVPRANGSALGDRWRALRASGHLGFAVGVGLFGLGCVVGLLGADRVRAPRADVALADAWPAAPSPVEAFTAPGASQLANEPAPPPPHPAPVLAPPASTASPAAGEASPVEPSVTPRDRPLAADTTTARSGPRRPTGPRVTPPRRAAPSRDWRGALELLERAERAVRADNVALALALLGEFDERYPESALVEERAAVETMAYCQAGSTDGAARAARFLNTYPSSLYRTRVDAACSARAPASSERGSDKTTSAGH